MRISTEIVCSYYRNPSRSLSERKVFNYYKKSNYLIRILVLGLNTPSKIYHCEDIGSIRELFLPKESNFQEKHPVLAEIIIGLSLPLIPLYGLFYAPLIREMLLWDANYEDLVMSMVLGCLMPQQNHF
jgi:hypothetical protein